MRWSCRQYRALLPGYIERGLSPRQRERVSRHLNACPDCYVAYIEQRQIARELAISLPRVGALAGSNAPRLEQIRAAVMAEVAAPKRTIRLSDARFSLVALMLMMALLLPLSMRGRVLALPTPTQPQPEHTAAPGTAVAAASPTETATLTATLQANYAPVIGATDTP